MESNNQVATNTKRTYTEDELEEEVHKYGKLRQTVFPVARAELRMVGHTAVMLMIIIFCYSAIKSMKNATVCNEANPSSIPWLKLMLVLPTNMIAIGLTQKLVVNQGTSRAYTIVISAFIAIFMLYAVLFLFLKVRFMPLNMYKDLYADSRMAYFGLAVTDPIVLLLATPGAAIYYIVSEMFGSLATSYLFWAFTNEYVTGRQAERLNPMFTIACQIGLLISTIVVDNYNSLFKKVETFESYERLNLSFPFLMCVVLFCFIAHKRYFESNVLINPVVERKGVVKKKSGKKKVSLKEALSISISSKLVIAISITVLAYNLCLNIVETFSIRVQNTRAEEEGLDKKVHVGEIENQSQRIIAFAVILISFIPSGKIIAGGGFWLYTSVPLICTAISAFTGPLLVYFNYNKIKSTTEAGDPVGIFGSLVSSLRWEEYIARAAVICFRIVKYAFFDISKESFSMRINENYRALFKGVYDGHFGKLGKAFGSIFTISLFFFFSNNDIRIVGGIPAFSIMAIVVVLWTFSIIYMVNSYNKSKAENRELDIDWISKKSIE